MNQSWPSVLLLVLMIPVHGWTESIKFAPQKIRLVHGIYQQSADPYQGLVLQKQVPIDLDISDVLNIKLCVTKKKWTAYVPLVKNIIKKLVKYRKPRIHCEKEWNLNTPNVGEDVFYLDYKKNKLNAGARKKIRFLKFQLNGDQCDPPFADYNQYLFPSNRLYLAKYQDTDRRYALQTNGIIEIECRRTILP